MIRSITRGSIAGLAMLLLGSSAPVHGKPAVDEPSLALSTGYGFTYRDQEFVDLNVFGNASALLPEERSHSLDAGATFTFPVSRIAGGRVGLATGAQRRDIKLDDQGFGFPLDFDRDDWGWQIQTGLDLFLRDPDLGYLEAGYSYRYDEINQPTLREESSHFGAVAAGWFLSPSGMSPIDLEGRFTYRRVTRTSRRQSFTPPFRSLSDTTFPVYQVQALASVYLGDRLRLGLGGLYSFADLAPLDNRWERQTVAVAEARWLASAGRRSAWIMSLRATAGEARLSSSLANFEVPVASVGIAVSVLHPGSDSLLQLLRERL